MAAPTKRITVKYDDTVVLIAFTDRNLLEENEIQQVGDEIKAVIDDDPAGNYLISFSNIEHLSSAALGVLLSVNLKLKKQNGKLRLAGISKEIMEVFKITELTKIFQIHETTEKALKSFK